jgi:fructoselysine/glucoselysine PTS system EIIA component
MRKFLITGHGTFSSGLKSSLDLIIGQTDHVFVIDAYVDGNTTIESGINTFLINVTASDEIIVFTDLMGGSITNQVLRYALRENVHVVSGMNLPLLIEIIMASADSPVDEVIESAIVNAREQITYVNKLINKVNDHD